MSDLSTLINSISGILGDAAYPEAILVNKINAAVSSIAGGIRMPDGQVSPPLPDLFTMGTVATSLTLPYVSLPADYQRQVSVIADSSGNLIYPPLNGDYYSFALFLKQINNLNMTEAGSVYRVAVKGTKLYYQGIPTVAETLGVHYYKKPTDMVADADEPEGIPDHLQERLIKSFVLKEIYGEMIEAGVNEPAAGTKYWTSKFYETMTDLLDYVGIDGEPTYYMSVGDIWDGGACD